MLYARNKLVKKMSVMRVKNQSQKAFRKWYIWFKEKMTERQHLKCSNIEKASVKA